MGEGVSKFCEKVEKLYFDIFWSKKFYFFDDYRGIVLPHSSHTFHITPQIRENTLLTYFVAVEEEKESSLAHVFPQVVMCFLPHVPFLFSHLSVVRKKKKSRPSNHVHRWRYARGSKKCSIFAFSKVLRAKCRNWNKMREIRSPFCGKGKNGEYKYG